MAKIERIRQDVPGAFGPEDLAQKAGQGWRLVALEWEREVPEDQAAGHAVEEVPFGLQVVANGPPHLEENPTERAVLFLMMELTIQDGPYSAIAEELNQRGYGQAGAASESRRLKTIGSIADPHRTALASKHRAAANGCERKGQRQQKHRH